MEKLVPVHDVAESLREAGVSFADCIRGDTYRDRSTLFVVPSRGLIHPKIVESWLSFTKPLNAKSGFLFVAGDEVGVAYNRAIASVLADERYSSFSYILTLEDDNIIPSAALLLLQQTMEAGPWDAVAGLYHMKGPLAVPMAFGHPDVRTAEGELDMQPRDMTEAILSGEPMEVNGIACGCTLWKLSLFREIDPPWFQTMTRLHMEGTVEIVTQDMFLCRRARAAGKRFAVDPRVKVGHLDVTTGKVY